MRLRNSQRLFIGTWLWILLQTPALALDLALEAGRGDDDTDRGGGLPCSGNGISGGLPPVIGIWAVTGKRASVIGMGKPAAAAPDH
jgi:hypothetical protein